MFLPATQVLPGPSALGPCRDLSFRKRRGVSFGRVIYTDWFRHPWAVTFIPMPHMPMPYVAARHFARGAGHTPWLSRAPPGGMERGGRRGWRQDMEQLWRVVTPTLCYYTRQRFVHHHQSTFAVSDKNNVYCTMNNRCTCTNICCGY